MLLAGGLSLAGMKLYVKPKEAMERVAGTGIEPARALPRASQPGVPRPGQAAGQSGSGLAQGRHGDAAPADPGRLSQSERAEDSVRRQGGVAALLLPVIAAGGTSNSIDAIRATSSRRSWRRSRSDSSAPTSTCGWLAKKRQKQIQRGLANALDLLVVCVESRPGTRSGDSAGLQGTGARASGDQRRVGHRESGTEGRQAPRRGVAQSGRPHRRSTISRSWWRC